MSFVYNESLPTAFLLLVYIMMWWIAPNCDTHYVLAKSQTRAGKVKNKRPRLEARPRDAPARGAVAPTGGGGPAAAAREGGRTAAPASAPSVVAVVVPAVLVVVVATTQQLCHCKGVDPRSGSNLRPVSPQGPRHAGPRGGNPRFAWLPGSGGHNPKLLAYRWNEPPFPEPQDRATATLASLDCQATVGTTPSF